MADTLIITNTDAEWPMGSLPHGRVEGYGRRALWRSLNGDPDSGKLKVDVSGLQLLRVSTNERLSPDMILWLLSRIRGNEQEFSDPDGKEICIWRDKCKKAAALAIGGQMLAYSRDTPLDREILMEWITASLEKNAKNFKGEREND